MRGLIISCLLALCPAWCARATPAPCDLAPSARPDGLEAYIDLARACLEQPPAPARFRPDLEAEILKRVNAARADAGLTRLTLRPALRAPARFHALDLAWTGRLAHEGSGGRSPGERISALDRRLVRAGMAENVSFIKGDFRGEDLAGIIHASLMDSPGHRANILSPRATHLAIGVVDVQGEIVTAQLFVNQAGEYIRNVPPDISPAGLARLQPQHSAWPEASARRREAGDGALLVRATRPGPEPNVTEWMELAGPAVSAAEPKSGDHAASPGGARE